ncbi:unnamed protein product [Somion occarium]|uniref:Transmembrane protein n=1 Tax=Somion occarium TaxID=3059160 RepID=A0ABP1E194_9APHY
MSFYTLGAHARQAHASPSISLEKGAYRMRAPRKRNVPAPLNLDPTVTSQSSSSTTSTSHGIERYLFILVFLLVLAVFSCFGVAYYLFTTSPRVA